MSLTKGPRDEAGLGADRIGTIPPDVRDSGLSKEADLDPEPEAVTGLETGLEAGPEPEPDATESLVACLSGIGTGAGAAVEAA